MSEELSIAQFSEELTQSIASIWRFMLQRKSDALLKGKITFPQYLVLDLLFTKGKLKMNDLARLSHTSLPAMTGIVNRLVKMKIVKRIYSDNDRRVIFVEATSSGKNVTNRVKVSRRAIIKEMFSDISGLERENYIKVIRKIKKKLYDEEAKG